MIKSKTKKELATISGLTYRRLYDIDLALPPDGKLFVQTEDGKYSLPIFVQRWVAYNVDKSTEDVGSPMEDIKAKHERVKMRKTELEVMKIEGRMVEVQDVYRLWSGVVQTIRTNLLRVASRVAPRLIMSENADFIAAEIDQSIREALTELSKCPVPDYEAASVAAVEEDEEEV